jgi:invasion protein IalB
MRVKSQLCAFVAVIAFSSPLFAQDAYREPESKVTVDDWSLECYLRADGSPESCQAYHRVLMNNATQIALVAAFAIPANGEGVLYQISLPLGIDLLAGATLTVDIDYSVGLPITRCTMQGCLLEGRLTGTPLNALMNGTISTVTIQIPGQSSLAIPMSLKGFSTSIRRIEAATRPKANETTQTDDPEASINAPQTTLPDVPDVDVGSGIDPALTPVTSSKR